MQAKRTLRRVCVYCASSARIHQRYLEAAASLGRELALHDITLVYGGSSLGAMGALASGALAAGGRVVGVIPRFMYDLEWGRDDLTELVMVDDMAQRKKALIDDVDGIVALPGGIGTFEEVMEAMALKSLEMHRHPIALVNIGGYYDPLIAQFRRGVEDSFMDHRLLEAWTVVTRVEDVLRALESAPEWHRDARSFAQLLSETADRNEEPRTHRK